MSRRQNKSDLIDVSVVATQRRIQHLVREIEGVDQGDGVRANVGQKTANGSRHQAQLRGTKASKHTHTQ